MPQECQFGIFILQKSLKITQPTTKKVKYVIHKQGSFRNNILKQFCDKPILFKEFHAYDSIHPLFFAACHLNQFLTNCKTKSLHQATQHLQKKPRSSEQL